ncbi:EthD family reductase [Microbacterium sp. LRZ72]|uniref:EthD family reductase n=1 Tax=Microbacterium sp. LRZ72 TaxID=2942481 RepID=UPI0029A7BF9E|nr:EthD family reductase [Microbacterium sp. LRZ72]MDX2376346.1 EthD family reductase [Microbacterium sp. LRZ72]
MHKLIVLYPPPTDPAAFEEYYRSTHLALAKQLPGTLGQRFTLSVDAAEGESPYFAIFEADFVDKEAMVAAITSPAGQAVQADVENYASGGAIVLDYDVEAVP